MNGGWPIGRLLYPSSWPLTVRVPAVVVLLMMVVSAVISERVLSRLVTTQNKHLTELTGAYLDGVSSAVLPHVLRQDVWETFDVLDRATRQYNGLDVVSTTVTDDKGIIIASSRPREHITQERLPGRFRQTESARDSITIREDASLTQFRRELVHQGRTIGAIHGEVRMQSLIAERWSVLLTLILTNAALTLALAVFGYLMIRRMVRPVGLLTDYMRVDLGGDVAEIPDHLLGRPESEFGRLFRRYNSLVSTVRERERLLQTLAEEERLAALGRLSSVMAHEINNPLGGMLNAVQTLKRHGQREDVRSNSINLLERGLLGIRNVVRSTLATYRPDRETQCLTPEHLEDLAVLIGPEIRRKAAHLMWDNRLTGSLDLPAQPVRDAALNLLLNACAASQNDGTIEFEADVTESELILRIGDTGPGLPERLRVFLQSGSPEMMPAGERGGLGLWIVRRLVTEMSGTIRVESRAGTGTNIYLAVPFGSAGNCAVMTKEFSHVA